MVPRRITSEVLFREHSDLPPAMTCAAIGTGQVSAGRDQCDMASWCVEIGGTACLSQILARAGIENSGIINTLLSSGQSDSR